MAVLRRVVELGVDHIDTAHFYGPANELIREAVRPEDDVLIASEAGADPDPGTPVPLRLAQRPEQLRAGVEATLVGLGRIPLVNLRRTDAGSGLRAEGGQVVGLDDQFATAVVLRDEGEIGAVLDDEALDAIPTRSANLDLG